MFYVCLKPCCSAFLPGPHCSVWTVLYHRPTCPWSRSILAASSASCEEDEEQNEGVHVIVGQVEQQVTVRSIKHQKTCRNFPEWVIIFHPTLLQYTVLYFYALNVSGYLAFIRVAPEAVPSFPARLTKSPNLKVNQFTTTWNEDKRWRAWNHQMSFFARKINDLIDKKLPRRPRNNHPNDYDALFCKVSHLVPFSFKNRKDRGFLFLFAKKSKNERSIWVFCSFKVFSC